MLYHGLFRTLHLEEGLSFSWPFIVCAFFRPFCMLSKHSCVDLQTQSHNGPALSFPLLWDMIWLFWNSRFSSISFPSAWILSISHSPHWFNFFLISRILMFVKVKTTTRFTQKSVPLPSLSFILFHHCLVNRLRFSPFVFNKTKNKGKKTPNPQRPARRLHR